MYLYSINYTAEQQDLCTLEMRRLFQKPLCPIIISDINYPAGRSAYFKEKMNVLVCETEWDLFIQKISLMNVEHFKMEYFKYKDDALIYEKRMALVKTCALQMNGKGSLDEKEVIFGVTHYQNMYYLGIIEKDHQTWQLHQTKPQSYSQSLSARDARTLVNIATGGNDISIVDPCCGVGTVLLEALEMGHRIDGYEIHKGVAWKGNRNLEYFGYEKIIQHQDMHTIGKHYDVAILDIPYNLYSSITSQEQYKLIETCHRIANHLVLISYEQLNDMIVSNQWRIVDKCCIKKIKMQRYIYYCERSSL